MNILNKMNITVFKANDSDTNQQAVPICVTVILCVLIILSILSNFLVCCAFLIQPRLRKVLYYPVLNLAIADILCGMLAMTSYLAKKHVFGGLRQQLVCDMSRFTYFVTEYASVLSLTIISVDRALAILRPLTYNITVTSKRMKTVLVALWGYTIFVSSLPFFWRNSSSENCSFLPTRSWSLLVIFVNVLLPFLIITVCQGAIYTVAIRHSINIRKQKRTVLREETSHVLHESSLRSDAWITERKSTITLSVVIGMFILCWGPSTIYYSIQQIHPIKFHKTFYKNQGLFNASVKLLTFLNSCFNPFIYAWLNKDFRHAFIQVLTRRGFYLTNCAARRQQNGGPLTAGCDAAATML